MFATNSVIFGCHSDPDNIVTREILVGSVFYPVDHPSVRQILLTFSNGPQSTKTSETAGRHHTHLHKHVGAYKRKANGEICY